jgi:hypothetical protein
LRANDNPSNAVSPHRYFGFRYSTQAGDANWTIVCGDNGSQTVVDTGIALSTTVFVALSMEWDRLASAVRFYINGTLVYTSTTHLPSFGDLLGTGVSVRTRDGGGVAKALDVATIRFYTALF